MVKGVNVRFFRGILRICVGLGVLTLLGSYFGALHPLGDSLAVFRVWIAGGVAGVAALALFLRQWKSGLLAVGLAVWAAAGIAFVDPMQAQPDPPSPDLIVYAKNLGSGRTDWSALAPDIEGSGADIVLLQEVTQQRMRDLAGLLPDHPHQHICNFSGRSAMAVASRYPLSGGGCTDQRSLAYAMVDAPSGPVWVASIHQVWPYPYDQAALLPDILAVVEDAPARQVIAGDFNMVPWGHSVQAIAGAGGLQRISPVVPTIEVRGVGLPIDHVLTDGQGTVTRVARMGSDHFGLVARIVWD